MASNGVGHGNPQRTISILRNKARKNKWCNTLGLKNEKSFQRIVLHLCIFEWVNLLNVNDLSLV